MPRPARTDRPVSKHLHLPESLAGKVELLLFSELEGKVPHGAWQAFICRLIEEHFQRQERVKQALARVPVMVEQANRPGNMHDPEVYGGACRALSDKLLKLEGYGELVDAMNKHKRHWA